ncbi:hypothetical protein F3Y22_tig00110482pilonHSYRG00516 [Hibiscus syriacus]|uniref:WRKY domain-containing protein n=1 Tax=Hibiscus syriacus TaxID=106335 RepID=A0A6A3ADG7_HIBSY|nr:hypothetical protein F3Y22_tig00110482pilonHSYRG00516 [Hibiscus syriacus]
MPTSFRFSSHNPSSQGTAHLASELIDKILTSFDQALAVLTSLESAQSHNEDSCIDSSKTAPGSMGKRGCYKRKRSAQAWTAVSATMEDGHTWRKYGQKEILNSKHPRSYLRCSRKYDQGCRAIKQVQKIDDGSQMYRTTYIGTHTCTNYAVNAPPLIITNSESWETGAVDSEILIKRHHDQRSDPTPTGAALKQETKEETSSDVTDMWKDLIDGFEYCSEPVGMVHPSCAELSCRNFELEFGIKPMEFENDFGFDDSDECVV